VFVVAFGGTVTHLRQPRVATLINNVNGCSFASAIDAGLARGLSTMDAIAAAKEFVHGAVTGGARWSLGKGHGPLDHFGWSAARS